MEVLELPCGDGMNQQQLVRHLVEGMQHPAADRTPHLVVLDDLGAATSDDKVSYVRFLGDVLAASGKCHMVLVDEAKDRSSEQGTRYLADVVLHTDVPRDRKTIEIAKSRYQVHALGRHEITAARGIVACTDARPDEPAWWLGPSDAAASLPGSREEPQYHIRVIPSLHRKFTVLQRMRPSCYMPDGACTGPTFGLKELDELRSGVTFPGDLFWVTGERHTYKSALARAFLSRAFADPSAPGVVVLVTQHGYSELALATRLGRHLGRTLSEADQLRVLVVSAGKHAVSVDCLVDAIECAIIAAHRIASEHPQRAAIRVAIDDWSTIEQLTSGLPGNPIALPYLEAMCRAVSARLMIVSSRPGTPFERAAQAKEGGNASVPQGLYTWQMPRSGERCVAAAVPTWGPEAVSFTSVELQMSPDPNAEVPAVCPRPEWNTRQGPQTRPSRPEAVKGLRVVVASPSDVAEERQMVSEAVNELNEWAPGLLGIRLDVSRWETDAQPGFAPGGPQELIDSHLKIEDCDLLIGIFWKRFGTPVSDADSGTEHEFLRAYRSWREKGRPQIMVYFCTKEHATASVEDAQQALRVAVFKQDFPREGLWWPYDAATAFERLVRSHLRKYLIDASGLT